MERVTQFVIDNKLLLFRVCVLLAHNYYCEPTTQKEFGRFPEASPSENLLLRSRFVNVSSEMSSVPCIICACRLQSCQAPEFGRNDRTGCESRQVTVTERYYQKRLGLTGLQRKAVSGLFY